MNESVDQICAEIQKLKEFQAIIELITLELINTTTVHHLELTTFNEADMNPRQPEETDTPNKRVATSPRRQQCDLKRAGNKGECLVFDLFKNRLIYGHLNKLIKSSSNAKLILRETYYSGQIKKKFRKK